MRFVYPHYKVWNFSLYFCRCHRHHEAETDVRVHYVHSACRIRLFLHLLEWRKFKKYLGMNVKFQLDRLLHLFLGRLLWSPALTLITSLIVDFVFFLWKLLYKGCFVFYREEDERGPLLKSYRTPVNYSVISELVYWLHAQPGNFESYSGC